MKFCFHSQAISRLSWNVVQYFYFQKPNKSQVGSQSSKHCNAVANTQDIIKQPKLRPFFKPTPLKTKQELKIKKSGWNQLKKSPHFKSWLLWAISWSLSAVLCHFIDPFRLSHFLIARRINSYFYTKCWFKSAKNSSINGISQRSRSLKSNLNTGTKSSLNILSKSKCIREKWRS